MLDSVYLGNSIQHWIIALAIVVGSLAAGWIISAFIRLLGKRFKSEFMVSVAAGAGDPVTALVVLFGVRIAAESLALPVGVREIANNATVFCTVVVFTWLAANAYDAVHRGVFEPYAKRPGAGVDLHLFAVLRTIINIVIWIIGLASALNSVGFEVSAILAGLGLGGMALALASQDTVANVFGGVLVLTQRPFKIGERIEVDGIDGWVQHVGLRQTVVKNWYGRTVLIPNKRFTDSVVINIDSQSVYFQELRLRLAPETTAAQLKSATEILHQIAVDGPLLDNSPWIALDKIGHGYFEIEFWYGILRWTSAQARQFPDEYEKICRGKTWVNLEVISRFEAAGIRFALPIQAYVGSPAVLADP
ncbi:mechanosensitive ion channel family protein [Nannocystis pusilla]|uniref:Mechanosensitive ion channel family protein n=1 Tax=Nannocystis pusilla TaxID=889268 RepID=A0ABS7TR62_9BACT|nr:mechanosensitive ion channel domain-containing protein [Nannocystis pusilla]MBZ5710718.1 mechanosensitive ion channel family protein [Nannocystis pusilla]